MNASTLSIYNDWSGVPTERLMDMGKDFDLRNSSDSALVCYSVVADRLRGNSLSKEEKHMYSRALNNIGYIYSTFIYDYPKSIEYLQEARKVADECGYKEGIVYANLNLGGIYLSCNVLYGNGLFQDDIYRYLDEALRQGLELGEYDAALVSFINMGQLFFENAQPVAVRKAIQTLRGARIPQDNDFYGFALSQADGLEAYMRRDFTGAAEYFRECIKAIRPESMTAKRLENIALFSIAEAQKASRDYSGAIKTMEQVVASSEANGFDDDGTSAYRTMAELHDLAGDTVKGNEYRFLHLKKKDSIISDQDMTMLARTPIAYELNQIKEDLYEEKIRRRFIISWAVALSVCLISLLMYVFTLVRSRRKMKTYINDLYLKNVELLKADQRERDRRAAEAAEIVAESDAASESGKYASSPISPEESRAIADRILMVMDDTDMISNPEFSLKDMADKIGCAPKVVSRVVNETLGKNFRSLLNEYRIREACARLLDTDRYGMYTVEHIAESVGFNSRSNFSVTFKKITGLTPAQFQQNARRHGE